MTVGAHIAPLANNYRLVANGFFLNSQRANAAGAAWKEYSTVSIPMSILIIGQYLGAGSVEQRAGTAGFGTQHASGGEFQEYDVAAQSDQVAQKRLLTTLSRPELV